MRYTTAMQTLSCLCGRIEITLARRPEFVNACNCAFCRKSGAAWANCDPADVTVSGEAAEYRREDKAGPAARLRFCGTCGATTHWTLTDSAVARYGNGVMGVNMRLADEEDLTGIEERYPDGRAWDGQGDFGYVRPPHRLGG